MSSSFRLTRGPLGGGNRQPSDRDSPSYSRVSSPRQSTSPSFKAKVTALRDADISSGSDTEMPGGRSLAEHSDPCVAGPLLQPGAAALTHAGARRVIERPHGSVADSLPSVWGESEEDAVLGGSVVPAGNSVPSVPG